MKISEKFLRKKQETMVRNKIIKRIAHKKEVNTVKKKDDQCNICWKFIKNVKGGLNCQNTCKSNFCFKCINKWSKTETTCPCCRKPFTQIQKKNLKDGTVETVTVAHRRQRRETENVMEILLEALMPIIRRRRRLMEASRDRRRRRLMEASRDFVTAVDSHGRRIRLLRIRSLGVDSENP